MYQYVYVVPTRKKIRKENLHGKCENLKTFLENSYNSYLNKVNKLDSIKIRHGLVQI